MTPAGVSRSFGQTCFSAFPPLVSAACHTLPAQVANFFHSFPTQTRKLPVAFHHETIRSFVDFQRFRACSHTRIAFFSKYSGALVILFRASDQTLSAMSHNLACQYLRPFAIESTIPSFPDLMTSTTPSLNSFTTPITPLPAFSARLTGNSNVLIAHQTMCWHIESKREHV